MSKILKEYWLVIILILLIPISIVLSGIFLALDRIELILSYFTVALTIASVLTAIFSFYKDLGKGRTRKSETDINYYENYLLKVKKYSKFIDKIRNINDKFFLNGTSTFSSQKMYKEYLKLLIFEGDNVNNYENIYEEKFIKFYNTIDDLLCKIELILQIKGLNLISKDFYNKEFKEVIRDYIDSIAPIIKAMKLYSNITFTYKICNDYIFENKRRKSNVRKSSKKIQN